LALEKRFCVRNKPHYGFYLRKTPKCS
jgi:hypothetical protein